MQRRHQHVLPILAFLLIVLNLQVTAQEDKESKEDLTTKPTSELSPADAKKKQEQRDAIEYGIPTTIDNTANSLRHPTKLEDLENRPHRPSAWNGPFPRTSYVTFGPKDIHIHTSYSRSGTTVSRNDPSLRNWLDKGDVFILKGEFTEENEHWFKTLGQTVTQSNLSPKRSDNEVALAATLTLRPFKPQEAVLLNALPYEREGGSGQQELNRMKLRGTPEGWESTQHEVRKADGQIPVRRATKAAVLREFQAGKSNVLFVIAHSNSNAIFLPGVTGGKITMQELDSIRRESAPNRTIVLLACKTGGVNGSTQSLAETLIKNRLASVVFASDEFIYTKDVAEMLRNLQGSAPLGQVFESLRAIVRVDDANVPWDSTKPNEAVLIVRDGPADGS